MIMPKNCNVTPEQWDQATDFFELGFRNGRQLAAELGVSPQTVMREMKKRGAKKGSRVNQTVVQLEAFLNRKRQREARMRAAAEYTAAPRRAAGLAAIDRMVKALTEADRRGDITLAEDVMAQTATAFGARVPRKVRRKA